GDEGGDRRGHCPYHPVRILYRGAHSESAEGGSERGRDRGGDLRRHGAACGRLLGAWRNCHAVTEREGAALSVRQVLRRRARHFMLKPEPLRRGDLIGVVAPAGAVDAAVVTSGVAFLEDLGYRVFVGAAVFKRSGYL